MSMPHVTRICIYPVKSTAVLDLSEAVVAPRGLKYDRRWALINNENVVVTARELPELLNFKVEIAGNQLVLRWKGGEISTHFEEKDDQEEPIVMFGHELKALLVDEGLDQWISQQVGAELRLVGIASNNRRVVAPRHGGRGDELLSLADTSPIHLLSEASVAELNTRLSTPVTIDHFRPNIVVDNITAHEEDGWKSVQIGDLVFDVHDYCKRCVFTTIDPDTKVKNPEGEPLRTLATYRRNEQGKVKFGISLVPKNSGNIRVGDQVQPLT